MRIIRREQLNQLTDDELSLILYVVSNNMGLDPLFICSIKKIKIFKALQEIQNTLNENGKQILDKINKKIFIEYTGS